MKIETEIDSYRDYQVYIKKQIERLKKMEDSRIVKDSILEELLLIVYWNGRTMQRDGVVKVQLYL